MEAQNKDPVYEKCYYDKVIEMLLEEQTEEAEGQIKESQITGFARRNRMRSELRNTHITLNMK